MGKYSLKLVHIASSIPVLGFFIRAYRMLSRFERFEQEQLPRMLRIISELTQSNLELSRELTRLKTLASLAATADQPAPRSLQTDDLPESQSSEK